MYEYMNYKIRAINETDLEQLLKWRNSERIRKNMFTDHIISMDEHSSWYRGLLNKNNCIYGIFEANNTPLGLTYFTDINYQKSISKWGFYLGKEDLPEGTGSVMGYVSMEYAFNVLNLFKICGEVFAFNMPSRGLFRKLGYKEERVLKKHVLKNGKYEDIILYGIEKEDWVNNRNLLEKKIFKDR